MKLAKAKLLKNVRNELLKMGYEEIKDSITTAEGLFIKRLPSSFYLSLGFTISNFYDSLFTADFYLSKTTIWGATWGDMPREAYKRVSAFLTQEERALYLDVTYNKEGAIDAWWSGDKEEDFDKFLQVVRITEDRFLKQDSLFDKVEKSTEVKELVDYVLEVFDIIAKGIDNMNEYQFIPDTKIGAIPPDWFKAAEIVLKNKRGILNKNTVKRLAADAWRQRNIK